MKTIWKYKLEVKDEQDIYLPRGGRILALDCQGNDPHIWVLVPNTDDTETEKVRFRSFGTGFPLDNVNDYTYLGTYLILHGQYVFHVFYCKDLPCLS